MYSEDGVTRRYRTWFYSILLVLVCIFIFRNSLQNSVESNAKSGWFSVYLKPILDPFSLISERNFHVLIRKLAHFTEFFVLGACLNRLSANVQKWPGWVPVMTALAVASVDETIQRFTGRTCSAVDVLLDVFGAVCGMLVAAAVVRLWRRIDGEVKP